jgi:hypothetical protein
MHVRVLLWLDLMFQESIFRSGTHIPTFVIQCDSPNRQNARHPNMPPLLNWSEWFLNNRQFLLQRSIHLKQDACYPVVQICHHKYLPNVDVEMTQDVTVKKKVCECAQLYTKHAHLQCPSMSCNMCTVRAKTSNIPGIVISQTDDGPSSLQATYSH